MSVEKKNRKFLFLMGQNYQKHHFETVLKELLKGKYSKSAKKKLLTMKLNSV